MMMKKWISLMLMLCMVISCVAASGYAASTQADIAAVGSQAELTPVGEDYGLGQTCADGNILQCFNWKLSQIKAELPNIAAAGFTSVQTSPLQPHGGSNQWYWLYQPTNFTVGNELGSYSELQSLCTEAHRYGVKIIVDVVANHLAGSDNGSWSGSIDSSLRNSAYFHNLGSHGDATDRYSTTQKNWGMPDLNSENTTIQTKVYNMIVNLKNAGVDGVRWDAAKHIALPSEECGFWTKMAQVDIFQYGEILGNPADGDTLANNTTWINEYADYMNVSDTIYGSDIMSAVRDGTTYKTTGYWSRKGVSSSKIVTWAESHDSYANEVNYGGWTKNLEQNTVDKAYAVLAARANSQTLYLSRPPQKQHQSIYYGVKGSTHFTSAEVAAVNHFHNAMIGTEEKFIGSTTYYAVLRSGGAVIVAKTNDTDVSVTNSGSMVPAGTYVDEISGSTFTVTAKTITGHVGSTGIAVLYNGTAPQPTEPEPTQPQPTQPQPTQPQPTQPQPTDPPVTIVVGDADESDEVDIIDATYIQRYLASLITLTDKGVAGADADQDGDVNIIDVTYIQRHLAGIEIPDSQIGERIPFTG